jgi:hypothetical protein
LSLAHFTPDYGHGCSVADVERKRDGGPKLICLDV